MQVRKPIKKLLVRGEEAEVYRFGNDRLRTPKRDVVRVKRFTLNTRKYTFKKFRELKLANALFPGLFIDVTKSVLTKNKFGMNKLYSRYEETTQEYKEFVKEFYAWLNGRGGTSFLNSPHYKEYERRISELKEKLSLTGIDANLHPVNVGIRPDGSFILFEIDGVDLPKLEEYVMKMPQSKQKVMVLREIIKYKRFLSLYR